MNSKTLRLGHTGMYSSTLNAYGSSMLFWKGINNVPNVHTACHPIHDVIRMIRIANITFARTLAINAFTVNRIAQKMHSYVSYCAVNASVASKQRDATCYPRCSKANDTCCSLRHRVLQTQLTGSIQITTPSFADTSFLEGSATA